MAGFACRHRSRSWQLRRLPRQFFLVGPDAAQIGLIYFCDTAAVVAPLGSSEVELLSEIESYDPQCDVGCDDACLHAHDGQCDDGGSGSSFSVCGLGWDCEDCGSRYCLSATSSGGTNMVDALALAKDSLDLAREAQNEATGHPRRGAVVMLTDGSNQPDYGGDEQTIAQAGQLKAAGYLVVAAGFGEADANVLGAITFSATCVRGNGRGHVARTGRGAVLAAAGIAAE